MKLLEDTSLTALNEDQACARVLTIVESIIDDFNRVNIPAVNLIKAMLKLANGKLSDRILADRFMTGLEFLENNLQIDIEEVARLLVRSETPDDLILNISDDFLTRVNWALALDSQFGLVRDEKPTTLVADAALDIPQSPPVSPRREPPRPGPIITSKEPEALGMKIIKIRKGHPPIQTDGGSSSGTYLYRNDTSIAL